MTQVLILNSGRGSRLGERTKQKNKCLVELTEGKTILDCQLDACLASGFREIVMTTGYLAEELEAYIREAYPMLSVTFVYNPDYLTTNYIYSMYLAREVLKEDLLLLHGDLYLEASLLKKISQCQGSAVVIQPSLKQNAKDFQAIVREGNIEKIAVGLEDDSTLPSQPVYKLTASDWRIWRDKISEFCENGNRACYAEEALNAVLKEINLCRMDFPAEDCFEVDDERDLQNARRILEKKERSWQ